MLVERVGELGSGIPGTSPLNPLARRLVKQGFNNTPILQHSLRAVKLGALPLDLTVFKRDCMMRIDFSGAEGSPPMVPMLMEMLR